MNSCSGSWLEQIEQNLVIGTWVRCSDIHFRSKHCSGVILWVWSSNYAADCRYGIRWLFYVINPISNCSCSTVCAGDCNAVYSCNPLGVGLIICQGWGEHLKWRDEIGHSFVLRGFTVFTLQVTVFMVIILRMMEWETRGNKKCMRYLNWTLKIRSPGHYC